MDKDVDRNMGKKQQSSREQNDDDDHVDEEETTDQGSHQRPQSPNDIETGRSEDSSSPPRETTETLTSCDDFKTRAVTRKSSRVSRGSYDVAADNGVSDMQQNDSNEDSVSASGNDFKTRAAIRKDSRRSRDNKEGSSSFTSEIQSPGAVNVEGDHLRASTAEVNEILVERQESSTIQEDATTNTVASTTTESDVVSNEPIIAQLVEEGNAGSQPHQMVQSIREELREDVRRELQQEMIASAVTANAVQVEIVTQDEEDPHPPLINNSSDPSETGDGSCGGNPLRYPPVDTGLVCVGLYMLLTMAIASIYMTEFFGGVCYTVGAWFYWIIGPETASASPPPSFVKAALELVRKAVLFVFVAPFVVWDFGVSILAVAWLELHAFAGYLFVATLNGCGSGRICGIFVRKVFVWKRWKIRRYHSNWKLKRDYLVLETWQEKELKDDYAILRANFEQQQLERQQLYGR